MTNTEKIFYSEAGELVPTDKGQEFLDRLGIFRRANPSLYGGKVIETTTVEEFCESKYDQPLTIGELVAKLQEFPQDAPIYRHDSEWGPEAVTFVGVGEYTDGKIQIS